MSLSMEITRLGRLDRGTLEDIFYAVGIVEDDDIALATRCPSALPPEIQSALQAALFPCKQDGMLGGDYEI